jgi:hypothetical protein
MTERQSDVRNLCERRANMRVDATILTDVFQKTRRSGFAWLKNLSKGGGLLRWCTTVSDGTRIRLAIRPPGRPAFEVDAEVLENGSNRYANSLATRVAFRDVPKTGQETLHNILCAALQNGVTPKDRGIVLFGNANGRTRALAEAMVAFGHRPILVSQPLNAIEWLHDETARIDAVCIAEDARNSSEMLTFLKEHFPEVRRILLVEPWQPVWTSSVIALVDAALAIPPSRACLTQALG